MPFRIEWLTLLEKRGLRIGHSPNIHEDMMDGGPMDVDYGLMVDQAERLIVAFNGATSVRLTTAAGSNLTLGVEGRRFVTDVMITDTEKAYRTAHVAFGSNIGFPGGVNESTTHIDYLVHRPTIVARFEGGAERLIVSDGDLRVELNSPRPQVANEEQFS